MATVELETGSDSGESTYTLYPEDSISNVGSNGICFGATSSFLVSSTQPDHTNRNTVVPALQFLEPKCYQPHRSPVEEPSVPHSSEPSATHTCLEESHPFTQRHRSSQQENSIVIPTSRKFVRFASSNGEHMWPFDDLDCENESIASFGMDVSSAFQTIPNDEEQFQSELLKDSRNASQVVDPWIEEANRSESYTSTSIKYSRSQQPSDMGRSILSHSPLRIQRGPKTYPQDPPSTARKRRPESRQAEFYFLLSSSVNESPSNYSYAQSAVAAGFDQTDTIPFRSVERGTKPGSALTQTEHVVRKISKDQEQCLHWINSSAAERNGVQISTTASSRRNDTLPSIPQRAKDENRWWLGHPLNRAGLEQAISPDAGASPTSVSSRRNGCVFLEFDLQSRWQCSTDNSQNSQLLRTRAEQTYHTTTLSEAHHPFGPGQIETVGNREQCRELKSRNLILGMESRGASIECECAKRGLPVSRSKSFREKNERRVKDLIKKCVGR